MSSLKCKKYVEKKIAKGKLGLSLSKHEYKISKNL